jgi:hypothetical protein
MTYKIFENGHLWEMNTCTQCGIVRKHINADQRVYKDGGGATNSRMGYSKNDFKTIDMKAGNCFIKL